MRFSLAVALRGLACVAAVLLAACTPGGDRPSPPPPPTTNVTLSGVAATGAPLPGATVTVYDRSGATVATATTGADGSFSVSIPATTQAPLVLHAVSSDQTLVSAFAETRSTRLNITPLTNLVAACLAANGDPLSLRQNSGNVTAANISARIASILGSIRSLRLALGDTTDPLTGEFQANGQGHDRVLQSLAVDIRPAGDRSNIELTVRRAGADTLRSSFTSAACTPPEIPGPINEIDLPPPAIDDMLVDLTKRLNACYALPLSQRVSGVSGTATAVVGTASAVIAPACRTLFLADDPASFLNGGARVGRDANGNGAFNSLFRSDATGARWENLRLEFLRDNPTRDPVFSYRAVDTQNNVLHDTLVARMVGGKLQLVGNQYIYSAGVRPFYQDREFLNQPAADFISTGYDVQIANRVDASGNPVFAKVEVTAPNGTKRIFRPDAGRAALSAERANGTLSGTSVLRLAGRFKNASTAGNPAQFETSLNFESPQFTEEQIRAYPEQGIWTFEFFHVDTTQANVVQRSRTIARAATLEEGAVLTLAQMTEAAKAELRGRSAATGRITFGPPSATTPNVADLSTAGGGDFWTVPAGAAAPSRIIVFGLGPDPDGMGPLTRPGYDDAVDVAANTRKVVVTCSRASAADNHCDSSTGVTQYAQNTTFTNVQLFSSTPRLAGAGKMYALYYLLPR